MYSLVLLYYLLDIFLQSALSALLNALYIWHSTPQLFLYTGYISNVSSSTLTLNSVLFFILPCPYFLIFDIFWHSTLRFLLCAWYTSNVCFSTPNFYSIFFFSLPSRHFSTLNIFLRHTLRLLVYTRYNLNVCHSSLILNSNLFFILPSPYFLIYLDIVLFDNFCIQVLLPMHALLP